MAQIHSTTTDEVFTLVRQALDAQREAGYQRATYAVAGLPTEDQYRAAQAEADAATVAMWRALYTYAERIGQ